MRRYYFFFSNAPTFAPFKLLKSGFRHVEMITELDNGMVFHINPLWGCTDHGLTNEIPLHAVISMLKKQGHTVVMYRQKAPDQRKMIARGPVMTCASYLAYTIGLPFAGVTPHQLYRCLIKRGGEVV